MINNLLYFQPLPIFVSITDKPTPLTVKFCLPPVYTRSSQPSAQGELWNLGECSWWRQKHAWLCWKVAKKSKWEFEKKRLRAYLLVCELAELRVSASFIITYSSKNVWLKPLLLPRALVPIHLPNHSTGSTSFFPWRKNELKYGVD